MDNDFLNYFLKPLSFVIICIILIFQGQIATSLVKEVKELKEIVKESYKK